MATDTDTKNPFDAATPALIECYERNVRPGSPVLGSKERDLPGPHLTFSY
jgi:hypothetical protein